MAAALGFIGPNPFDDGNLRLSPPPAKSIRPRSSTPRSYSSSSFASGTPCGRTPANVESPSSGIFPSLSRTTVRMSGVIPNSSFWMQKETPRSSQESLPTILVPRVNVGETPSIAGTFTKRMDFLGGSIGSVAHFGYTTSYGSITFADSNPTGRFQLRSLRRYTGDG